MRTLFVVRPATPNIGNDIINRATIDLLRETFGADTCIVNIPAVAGAQGGGLSARQVYDINRLADGVVIGGGNLLENGQLTIDEQALDALAVPLLLIGVAHGRIHGRDGALVDRTDAMPPRLIRRLMETAVLTLVRDGGTRDIVRGPTMPPAEVGGCPTLFMSPNPPESTNDGRVLLSLRHPDRMSVPPALQWRVAEDVRHLIPSLQKTTGAPVFLACHDYADLEFAAAFPDTPKLYFDNVDPYISALRRCRLSVSYRLHAFLPCLAFNTPSIHLSYDERGREAVATAGMRDWDVDITQERDVIGAVTSRAAHLDRYDQLRCQSSATIAALRATTVAGIERFAHAVRAADPREDYV